MADDVVILGGTEWGPDVNHTPQQMARAASATPSRRVLYVGRRVQGSAVRAATRLGSARAVEWQWKPRVQHDAGTTALEVGGSLAVLPLAGPGPWRAAQLRVLLRQLRQALAVAGIRPHRATLLLYWWHFPEVVEAFPWSRVVFDVIDDHSALGHNENRTRWNRQMAALVRATHRQAPRTTAVTAALARSLGPQSVQVPVAFDFLLARRLLSENPRPALQPHGPAVAYSGGVDARVDWDLVSRVSAARPSLSFYFLGGFPPRGLPPNVHGIGPLPYRDVLATLPLCTVGWIPFRRSRLTETSDFLKLWDYRVSALPVVASRLPSTERAASVDDAITLVEGRDARDWTAALDASLARSPAVQSLLLQHSIGSEARLARLLSLARTPGRAW